MYNYVFTYYIYLCLYACVLIALIHGECTRQRQKQIGIFGSFKWNEYDDIIAGKTP